MANNKYVGNEGLLEFGVKFLAHLKTLFGWKTGSTLMSPEDKEKLDGIDSGATSITVDDALSSSSVNPVQNKVINSALAGKVDAVSGKGLSTNDYTTAEKSKLSDVETGAQANVIESVKVNGTALTVISKAVDVTVPTKTSDLDNDSGFITTGDIPEGAAGSTTTPLMDGVAAVGSELAFARGDHRHPSDTTKADKSATVSTLTYDTTNKKITKTIDGTTTDVVTAAKIVEDGGALTTSSASTLYATKTELSNAVASVYKYKSTVADLAALNAITGQVTGDVYNVESDFTIGGKLYPAGTNVAWNGTAWDPLGGSFAIDAYMTNSEVDTLVDSIFPAN